LLPQDIETYMILLTTMMTLNSFTEEDLIQIDIIIYHIVV